MDRKQMLKSHLERVDVCQLSDCITKHKKMASGPFLFFRGSAPLFYEDLANDVLTLPKDLLSPPLTKIMGDCHTSNFGFLTEEGSHGDKVIFSPNDFDDACVGHAVWDLSRFITSLYLGLDHCQRIQSGELEHEKDYSDKPLVSESTVFQAARQFLSGYIQSCEDSIHFPETRLSVREKFGHIPILKKRWHKALNRASLGGEFHTKSTLAQSTHWTDFGLKFKLVEDKIHSVSKQEYHDIEDFFRPYMDDEILDIAIRLNAGTGSVNMERYYLLVGPESASQEQLNLCHIVEIKKQRVAAPIMSFKELSQVNRLDAAHLTVSCQRQMQRRPDLVLDHVLWRDAHWLIRSRHHAKVGIKPEQIFLGNKAVAGGLEAYANLCGEVLGLAHCRGDRRSIFFEQSIMYSLTRHIGELIDVCRNYSSQVVEDSKTLKNLLDNP